MVRTDVWLKSQPNIGDPDKFAFAWFFMLFVTALLLGYACRDGDCGNCCNATCVPITWLPDDSCEGIGFVLQCAEPTTRDPAACQAEEASFVGDGYCDDASYNNERCGWDGGDCCLSTCTGSAKFDCGDTAFECVDPNAEENRFPTCMAANPAWLGDGYCDNTTAYNNGACNWDDGDCCVATCHDQDYACGQENPFLCSNPEYADGTASGSRIEMYTTTGPARQTDPVDVAPANDNNVAIIVGGSIGGIVLLAVIFGVVFGLRAKRQRSNSSFIGDNGSPFVGKRSHTPSVRTESYAPLVGAENQGGTATI